jgi:hypothetical protein
MSVPHSWRWTGSRRAVRASTFLPVLALSVMALLGAMGASLAVSTAAAASPTVAAARPHIGGNPGGGYWLSATDGGIFNYGNAGYHGSTGGITLNKPIVGIAPTPDGNGYWEVASDGGIFSFGDAAFHGSTGSMTLNKPIVGMAATPNGGGYWLVGSDGGIFSFGNAAFHGSTGSLVLNQPIVGMAATSDGGGYWLVASDGGIFAFGDAAYHGSTGSIALNKPIVGMAATSDGGGYWLVASDGGIFNFGDAPFEGSAGSSVLGAPMVGMAATPDNGGYWLATANGEIYNYGDTQNFGSPAASGITLNKPIVGIAVSPTNEIKISPTNLTGVSCPTTTWCQAVDSYGNVIGYANGVWSLPHFVDPASGGFNGVSCPTTTFCMAVSYLGGYSIYQNGTWSPMAFPPPGIGAGLWAVSCSSASFCGLEVDNFGDLAFYIDGAWQEPTTNNGIGLGQNSTPISCVGTFCMYVTNHGLSQTSTDGTDLSTAVPIAGQSANLTSSVSCTSSTFCEAANTGALSAAYWNGSTWTASANFVSTGDRIQGLNAVSCVVSSCTAVDHVNLYTVSSNIDWSVPTEFDAFDNDATAVSCATPTFCMAVDFEGHAIVLQPYT